MTEYKKLTDEELIRRLRMGETGIIDYLMEKYKNLVRKEANAMYLLGGETDDLIQEGMIGLFKAVQDYDVDQEASFFSFARLCVTRQLYSAIEASNRKKHSPLNSYISLYEREDGEGSLIDMMESEHETNPEELLVSQEHAKSLEERLEKDLSELERRVLYLHLMGTDYKTIAKLLDRSPKTIDNALQRNQREDAEDSGKGKIDIIKIRYVQKKKSVYFVEFFVCTGKLQILIMIYAVKVKIGGIVMTKKILITGGAGYIGSHTALELLNEGYEVVVYDNLCNSSKESLKRVEELSGKHITFYEGDVMDETALKAMMEKEGVDAVIHCAALKGSRRICTEAIRVLP